MLFDGIIIWPVADNVKPIFFSTLVQLCYNVLTLKQVEV